MKNKKAKPKRKARKQAKEGGNGWGWVDDRLEWVPEKSQPNCESSDEFSIISWNVLADSYCSYRSHRNLPLKFQRHVFDRHQRQHHVRQILRRLVSSLGNPILALQEVDKPLEVLMALEELGYEGIETPTSPGGKNGRVDACGLYFHRDEWTCLQQEMIHLDDLASLRSSTGKEICAATRNSLRGFQTSFLKKNMAMLVRLKNVQSNKQIVIAVLHLFWNPNYEYVKLCQTHYTLERAKRFCDGDTPFLVCGDFNSQPGSHVYNYLSTGKLNAKLVAPWYSHTNHIDKLEDQLKDKANATNIELLAKDLSKNLSLDNNEVTSSSAPVRYLLDFTLNRFCRWLRILGIDSVLETEQEEKLRTKDGSLVIFDRCREEKRTLVTTASKLLLRKNCPPGAYVLDTKGLANLELSLVHLLLSHGVILEPRTFLTRCVVCNGMIEEVKDKERIKTIFEAHQAPDQLHEEIFEVFQCTGCHQGYWWCEKPTSSASRVKTRATNLLEACIQGGVPVAEDMAMFDFVDVEKIRSKNGELSQLDERLDIVEWLQDEELTNPFGPLTSAYSGANGEETLQFTNVTHDFVGHLDHIFFQNSLQVCERLYVPTTFEELNDEDVQNGHLLPSTAWPSDHLAVGCKFVLKSTSAESSPAAEHSSTATSPAAALFCAPTIAPPPASIMRAIAPPAPAPIMHPQRCGCGCVPPILSMFEMAELRKQARLKAENGVT